MGIKTIRFTKKDGSPFTGALTFGTALKYAQSSAGASISGTTTVTDLGGGVVEVNIPSTSTVGGAYLVYIDPAVVDVYPRAQLVCDGPFVWGYGSTADDGTPNVNIGPSAATISARDATTGLVTTLTAGGGGSITDGSGNVLFTVVRAPLPGTTGYEWNIGSNTAGIQVYPRAGDNALPVLPAIPDGYTAKVIRFTKNNNGEAGAPFEGALTFATYPEFRRNRNGVKVTPQIVDLGGGYVRVALPTVEDVACCCTVNIASSITDVFPRTHLVSMGSSVWLYGYEGAVPTPDGLPTPSKVNIQARKFAFPDAPVTLTGVGAGGLTMSATPDDVALSVLRFDYPTANESWTFTATPTQATGIWPEAGDRDLRARVSYPEINYAAKRRWAGDGEDSVQQAKQWTVQYGTRTPDTGGSPLVLSDGVPRITTRRDEVYNRGKGSTAFTVKYGDLHSNGARAEFVAKATGAAGGKTNVGYFYEGDDVWISWSSKFPADFKTNDGWSVFSQAHQTLDLGNGGPPISFIVKNTDSLHFSVMNGYYDSIGEGWRAYRYTTKLQRGFWQHFLLHIKWSQSMTVGFQELWVDGTLVMPRLYHNNMDVDGTTYWKLGWYRNKTSQSPPQTILHEDFNVWNSDPRLIGELPVSGVGAFSIQNFGVTALGTNVDPVVIVPPEDPVPEIPVDWVVIAPSFYNRYEDGPFGDPKMNGLEGPMFLLKPLLIALEPLYCIACSRADILAKLQFCWAHYEDYLNSKEYAAAEKQTQGMLLSRLAFAERMRFQNRLPDIKLKVPITPQ